MTVSYSADVAEPKPFRFFRLLFRWRGSFYKLIVHQFVIYFAVYTLLNVVHSFVLTPEQDLRFSEICAQLGRMSGYVVASVTFCLGFFIQQVYKRYCNHFQQVPWPDALAFLVSVSVRGTDKRGRLIRRTIVRYAVASIVLTWMNFSERMKVLFSELEFLVVAGFLTEKEVELLKPVRPAWRQMVALSWCAAVLKRARMEERIEDDFAMNAILKELDIIRMRSRRLIQLHNRPMPMAYFHTVIIGVYSFFWIAAVAGSHRYQTQELHRSIMLVSDRGEQWIIRLMAEVVTLLQFAICTGVLCTSRALFAPFGNDDNNIDVEEIVKRHLALGYLVVDELHSLIPEFSHEAEAALIFDFSDIIRSESEIGMENEEIHGLGFVIKVADPKKAAKAKKASAKSKKGDKASVSRTPSGSGSSGHNKRIIHVRSQSRVDRLMTFRKMN